MSENRGVFAEFYIDAVHLPFKSEEAGHPVYEDREFIRILVSGDSKTEVVREATKDDKERFAAEYTAFKRNEDQRSLNGMPLKVWPQMTPALIRMFEANNVFTVEQLADLSDSHIQNVGLGAREWSAKAKAFLEQAKDTAATQKYAKENEDLKARIADLERQMAELGRRGHKRDAA